MPIFVELSRLLQSYREIQTSDPIWPSFGTVLTIWKRLAAPPSASPDMVVAALKSHLQTSRDQSRAHLAPTVAGGAADDLVAQVQGLIDAFLSEVEAERRVHLAHFLKKSAATDGTLAHIGLSRSFRRGI
jgi:hypothetical protein